MRVGKETTFRKLRNMESDQMFKWGVSIVGGLVAIGFAAWLQTTNTKMDAVLTKVENIRVDVSAIKTKVERNEKDIRDLGGR